MSKSCRYGSSLLRRTGARSTPTCIAPRGLNNDCRRSNRARLLSYTSINHTQDIARDAEVVTQLQLQLASPVDTLRKHLLGRPDSHRASKINVTYNEQVHFQLHQHLRGTGAGIVYPYQQKNRWTRNLSLFSSFQSLVSAQIAACRSPNDLVRVLICAVGPPDQALQYKLFRRQALRGMNVQDLIVRRLEEIRKYVRERPSVRPERVATQMRARIHKSNLQTLSCLNIIISRLEDLGVVIQPQILEQGLRISAAIHPLSAFCMYFQKLWNNSLLRTPESRRRNTRLALQSLYRSYEHPFLDPYDTTTRQMHEILLGSGLHSTRSSDSNPDNLRSVLDLKDPKSLSRWIALLARCGAGKQLKEEWQHFGEHCLLDKKHRRKVICTFIIHFCLVGDSEMAWRIFQDESSNVPLNNPRMWRSLLDIADAKPELKDKNLEATLGNKWAEILARVVENLEEKLGLKWVPNDEGSEHTPDSFGGHHEFVQDDLLEYWTKKLNGPGFDANAELTGFLDNQPRNQSAVGRENSHEGYDD